MFCISPPPNTLSRKIFTSAILIELQILSGKIFMDSSLCYMVLEAGFWLYIYIYILGGKMKTLMIPYYNSKRTISKIPLYSKSDLPKNLVIDS